MNTSEKTDLIIPAFIKFQAAVKPIKRDKEVKVNKFSFKYAPLDTIMETIVPVLQSHGLAIMQSVDMDFLSTRLVHDSGQWLESCTFLNREHANMQGFGGEITYKRRYAMSALLGLVSDDDNDAPPVPRNSPTAGFFEQLSPRRQSYIADLAEIIKEKHADGNEWGAFEDYETITDGEEKVAIWSLLPSGVRSNLKKLNEAKKGAK